MYVGTVRGVNIQSLITRWFILLLRLFFLLYIHPPFLLPPLSADRVSSVTITQICVGLYFQLRCLRCVCENTIPHIAQYRQLLFRRKCVSASLSHDLHKILCLILCFSTRLLFYSATFSLNYVFLFCSIFILTFICAFSMMQLRKRFLSVMQLVLIRRTTAW